MKNNLLHSPPNNTQSTFATSAIVPAISPSSPPPPNHQDCQLYATANHHLCYCQDHQHHILGYNATMLPKTPLNCYPTTTSASNIVVGALCHYQVLTTAFATVSFTTPIIILHHDRHSLGVAIVAYQVFPLIFTGNVGFCLPNVILTHKSQNQFCGAYTFCCLHYLFLHEGFGREGKSERKELFLFLSSVCSGKSFNKVDLVICNYGP